MTPEQANEQRLDIVAQEVMRVMAMHKPERPVHFHRSCGHSYLDRSIGAVGSMLGYWSREELRALSDRLREYKWIVALTFTEESPTSDDFTWDLLVSYP